MKTNKRFLVKYSLRNLMRNPKRTLILFCAIAFSLTFVIWVFNFSDSGLDDMLTEITSQYTGKYQITHPKFDYFDEKPHVFNYLKENFPLYHHPNLAKRITTPVYLSGMKKTSGTLMVGIDADQESKITKFKNAVVEGNFFSDDSIPNPIILGKSLAGRLGAQIGDEVVALGQAADGSIANDLFKVIGLLDFGGGDLEEKLSFTTINKAREFLSMPEGSFHVMVGMDQKIDLNSVKEQSNIIPWQKLMPDVAVSMNFMNSLNWILTIILVFVMSLGVSNTLFVSFNEREKEINSLNIIGASSRWIALSLFIETFSLLVIAIIVGNILGLGLTLFFKSHPIDIRMYTDGKDIIAGGMRITPLLRPDVYLKNHINGSLVILCFVTLSMVYPLARVIRRSKRAHSN